MHPVETLTISELFADGGGIEELLLALQKRASAYAVITHIGATAQSSRDEPLLIRLCTYIATTAQWLDGDICIGITPHRKPGERFGNIQLTLMKGSAGVREIDQRFLLKGFFTEIRDRIRAARSADLAPLQVVQLADEQIILEAPRVRSILPTGLQPPTLSREIVHAPKAPAIPADLMPRQHSRPPKPPPRRRSQPEPAATVGRITLTQLIAEPLSPSERPPTERPPVPSDDVPTVPRIGTYSSVSRVAATLPKPPSRPPLHSDDDVDGGWDD